MIVLINGPFGVGKTTVATALRDKIPNSLLFDPEEVGFMLRNIIPEHVKYPEEKTDDFQDLQLWREMTVLTAAKLTDTYHRDLIIPMTIRNPSYFQYIQTGLKEIDSRVYHFCLLAEKETIEQRLRQRGDAPRSWPFLQTEKCLRSFSENPSLFCNFIRTDSLSVTEICSCILDSMIKPEEIAYI